jgi:di/tricarboxylate transporter
LANTLIPIEERSLTPQQVEALDRRRRRGQLFLVLCFQCLIVATLVTLWSGQDLTYSPGWVRPMFYWNAVLFLLAAVFGIAGLRMRRGSNEFLSY